MSSSSILLSSSARPCRQRKITIYHSPGCVTEMSTTRKEFTAASLPITNIVPKCLLGSAATPRFTMLAYPTKKGMEVLCSKITLPSRIGLPNHFSSLKCSYNWHGSVFRTGKVIVERSCRPPILSGL